MMMMMMTRGNRKMNMRTMIINMMTRRTRMMELMRCIYLQIRSVPSDSMCHDYLFYFFIWGKIYHRWSGTYDFLPDYDDDDDVMQAFKFQRKKTSRKSTVWTPEMVWSVYVIYVWACYDSVLLSLNIGCSTRRSCEAEWLWLGRSCSVCRTWGHRLKVRSLLVGDLEIPLINRLLQISRVEFFIDSPVYKPTTTVPFIAYTAVADSIYIQSVVELIYCRLTMSCIIHQQLCNHLTTKQCY